MSLLLVTLVDFITELCPSKTVAENRYLPRRQYMPAVTSGRSMLGKWYPTDETVSIYITLTFNLSLIYQPSLIPGIITAKYSRL